MTWSPKSWRDYPIVQFPEYVNKEFLEKVEQKLNTKPPLVFAGEVQLLREALSNVEKGNGFILQGGDCAESFDQFSAKTLPL